MRIALGIEYDGSAYNGWQRQRNGLGVQAVVEKALSRVAAAAVEVTCAGRTDTGVHATGQVAHFDTQAARSKRGWLLGANSNLPEDIAVTWAQPVADEFHARYSALSRRYRYLILNRPVRSSLFRDRTWWVHQPLDVIRMQSAAKHLVGKHDFSAFRAAGCQAQTATRDVFTLDVVRTGDWIAITVLANAFLQHMVRNVAGLLVTIGRGERSPGWAADVLASRDRKQGAVAAPAQGLTLIEVSYPLKYDLPVTMTPSFLPGA